MTQHEPSSNAASIASLSASERTAFLDSLSDNTVASLAYLFDFWAHPQHQKPPLGDWTTWVILGGRGAGKTRAGAEWVRTQVEGATPLAPGRAARFALIGETLDQAQWVMVEGESGILACSAPDRRPEWQASRRRLVWPNGAEARVFSAADPESLRGPQFDGAWSDELAKWRKCRQAWDMLQFGLRLGDNPRQMVTTTPRDNPVLIEIMEAAGTRVTHASTAVNRINLAPDFLDRLAARYDGTTLGRQELEGELVREHRGALWSRAMIEDNRAEAPELERVVVAVDPPVTSTSASDECGIVVAGIARRGGIVHGHVLADLSAQGLSPVQWADLAATAYRQYRADRLVAEVNQGGDLVESVVRQVAPDVAFRAVHATRGKRLRAEPVAALYEQGRVHHGAGFAVLEDQMCSFFADRATAARSPDRLDALVWALTDLMLDARGGAPKVRQL